MFSLTLIILIYIGVFTTSPIITLLHELGHAAAYLILTKPEKVTVLIGTYDIASEGWKVKIGRLHLNFKWSFPVMKGRGLCVSDIPERNPYKYITILLAGPFCSLIVSLVLGNLIFYFDLYIILRLYVAALMLFSLFSLLTNLAPRTLNVNDTVLFSDGKQILFTFKFRSYYKEFADAITNYNNGDLESSIEIFKFLLTKKGNDERLLRYAITISTIQKKYKEVLQFSSLLEKTIALESNDLTTRGYAYSMLKEHDAAIEQYKLAIQTAKNKSVALNNLGYEQICTGNFDEAYKALVKSAKIAPNFSYPISNLGYLNVLSNSLVNAKQLLDKAHELNPQEPYNYKYLGIYYLKVQNQEKALFNFKKGLALDSTLDLDEYLDVNGFIKKLPVSL